jgi:hypothetical protein
MSNFKFNTAGAVFEDTVKSNPIDNIQSVIDYVQSKTDKKPHFLSYDLMETRLSGNVTQKNLRYLMVSTYVSATVPVSLFMEALKQTGNNVLFNTIVKECPNLFEPFFPLTFGKLPSDFINFIKYQLAHRPDQSSLQRFIDYLGIKSDDITELIAGNNVFNNYYVAFINLLVRLDFSVSTFMRNLYDCGLRATHEEIKVKLDNLNLNQTSQSSVISNKTFFDVDQKFKNLLMDSNFDDLERCITYVQDKAYYAVSSARRLLSYGSILSSMNRNYTMDDIKREAIKRWCGQCIHIDTLMDALKESGNMIIFNDILQKYPNIVTINNTNIQPMSIDNVAISPVSSSSFSNLTTRQVAPTTPPPSFHKACVIFPDEYTAAVMKFINNMGDRRDFTFGRLQSKIDGRLYTLICNNTTKGIGFIVAFKSPELDVRQAINTLKNTLSPSIIILGGTCIGNLDHADTSIGTTVISTRTCGCSGTYTCDMYDISKNYNDLGYIDGMISYVKNYIDKNAVPIKTSKSVVDSVINYLGQNYLDVDKLITSEMIKLEVPMNEIDWNIVLHNQGIERDLNGHFALTRRQYSIYCKDNIMSSSSTNSCRKPLLTNVRNPVVVSASKCDIDLSTPVGWVALAGRTEESNIICSDDDANEIFKMSNPTPAIFIKIVNKIGTGTINDPNYASNTESLLKLDFDIILDIILNYSS